MAKELERAGLPTVLVTCLTNVAEMVGANRILAGVAIPHPVGDPGLAAADEQQQRQRLVLRALEVLTVPVDAPRLFAVGP
jgi:glycine reductase